MIKEKLPELKIRDFKIEVLKDNNIALQQELFKSWQEARLISIKLYKVLRDIKDILKEKEIGYIETYDKLEEYINKELEKYE